MKRKQISAGRSRRCRHAAQLAGADTVKVELYEYPFAEARTRTSAEIR